MAQEASAQPHATFKSYTITTVNTISLPTLASPRRVRVADLDGLDKQARKQSSLSGGLLFRSPAITPARWSSITDGKALPHCEGVSRRRFSASARVGSLSRRFLAFRREFWAPARDGRLPRAKEGSHARWKPSAEDFGLPHATEAFRAMF
jgi:hypothetical protein